MKKKVPLIAALSSDGTVHIVLGRKEYFYYGVDTAIYSFFNYRKPWQALNLIKKSAERVEVKIN